MDLLNWMFVLVGGWFRQVGLLIDWLGDLLTCFVGLYVLFGVCCLCCLLDFVVCDLILCL